MEPITILQAPSVLGLRPTGVEALPGSLLGIGLQERVNASSGGEVVPGRYDPQRDEETGMLNIQGIAEYTLRLAAEVERVRSRGEFPLVLGGDCSILLGNLLALRRQGDYGLLFIDGHADFYQPEANINGEAASSDLALATGRGPRPLTEFDGLHPLVRDRDVVVLGYRDAEEAAGFGSQPLPETVLAYDVAEVRRMGADHAARSAIQHLTRSDLDGFWIHFDVDVLDDGTMPAVDYRLPGGMPEEAVEQVLTMALGSGRAAGMDVTIFNPKLDPSGSLARLLVDLIGRAFDAAAHG